MNADRFRCPDNEFLTILCRKLLWPSNVHLVMVSQSGMYGISDLGSAYMNYYYATIFGLPWTVYLFLFWSTS